MRTKKHEAEIQRAGIIGWPVAHSVSPAMHNAAFDALGMDWRYELLPTPPDAVEQRVAELRTPGVAGANVTVPHKQAVIPFLDEVVGAAVVVGAVNTIVAADDKLIGHNTDVAGIHWALAQNHVAPAGWDVVVLGAGGAARAALYAIGSVGVARVTVFNRTLERALNLVADLRPYLNGLELTATPLADVGQLEEAVARSDLLVNATSVGMHPDIDASPLPDEVEVPAGVVVFDMVYNPQRTHLLKKAELNGARTVGGLDMLIGQGVEAFELWTGQTPPSNLMRQAALDALESG